MIFFLMVLVILVFVVLWNYDLHKILYVKSMSQNGGDSAALAAARWQGISLNLVGDLNIMQAMAAFSGDPGAAAAPAISNIQARLCYVGPMVAFMAAQQAAKNNNIYVHEGFTQLTLEHAANVRTDYGRVTGPGGATLFTEPYPGCWEEYASMLETIANDGIAAGPDNARFYSDISGAHTLLNTGFYDAIASRYWCWFFFFEPTLLEDYRNFQPCWWPALPTMPHAEYVNSEIFGLGLQAVVTSLPDMSNATDMVQALAPERHLNIPLLAEPTTNSMTWYCYDDNSWAEWNAMDTEGEDPFPATGTVKPQYDYTGADAVTRVETTATRLTPGPAGRPVSNVLLWTAAAKPFGYLNEADSPTMCGLVLPAFHDVALIPLDGSSAPSGGAYDLLWREHVEVHLPVYMTGGPAGGACWYCGRLTQWENPEFRQAGVLWLSSNRYQCVAQGSGGPHRSGGTSRGH